MALRVQGSATPMHPGMTPSHLGASTPGRDSAWAPVMPTPRHPSSEASGRVSGWDSAAAAVASAGPPRSSGGRASGWDQGPPAPSYSAPPITSIPQAGKGWRRSGKPD